MSIQAIVYTSNTGYTRQYAAMLAEKTGLPLYSLTEAESALPAGTEILYMGWFRMERVRFIKKAQKRFRIACLVGVGDIETGTMVEEFRKIGKIPADMPFFTLQGGLDIDRLHGIDKLLMKIMVRFLAAAKKKEGADAPSDPMLDLLLHGGSRVSPDNLTAVLDWVNNH